MRVAFSDMAYQLCIILQFDKLAIQHNRFGTAATQLFPLMASRLEMPFEFVAQSYAVSFYVFLLLVFLLAVLLGSTRMAIVSVLSAILLTADTFFWAPSDLSIGLGLICLGFALLEYAARESVWHWTLAVSAAVFATAAFVHPLVIFPFVFTCGYFCIKSNAEMPRKLVIGAFLFFIGVYLVKKFYFATEYEAEAMERLERVKQLFPNYLTLDTNIELLRNCLTLYYWLPITLGMVNVYYVIKRNWKMLLFVNVYLIAYLLLINVTQANVNVLRLYVESMYLPLALMLCVPLVYDVFPTLQLKQVLSPFLLLVFLTFGVRIGTISLPFQQRLDWVVRKTVEHRNEKLVVPSANLPMDTLIMAWALPYEAWIISMARNGSVTSLLAADDPSAWHSQLFRRDGWFTPWDVRPYSELPNRYFNFPDSSSSYKLVDKL